MHAAFKCGGALTVTVKHGEKEQLVWSNSQSYLSEWSGRQEASIRGIVGGLRQALEQM